jgi:hypothetical protein
MFWSTIIGRRCVTAVNNTPDPDVAVAAAHRPGYWRQQAGPFGTDLGDSGHVFRHCPRVPSTRRPGRSDRDWPGSVLNLRHHPKVFGKDTGSFHGDP